MDNHVVLALTMSATLPTRLQQVRVGIHTGAVIAGIVGDLKFCYDVWGEGVDGAVAMEQGGRANQIHVSQATYEKLVSTVDGSWRPATQQTVQTVQTRSYVGGGPGA